MSNIEERLLTRREVHNRYGLTVRFLEACAVRGNGPPMIKISNRMVRYRSSDIEDWLDRLKLFGNDHEPRSVR